jgi:hypothetical protein
MLHRKKGLLAAAEIQYKFTGQETVFIMVQENAFQRTRRLYYIAGLAFPKWPSGEIVPKQEIYGKYYKGGPSAVITNMAFSALMKIERCIWILSSGLHSGTGQGELLL